MRQLSASGRQVIEDVARRHGFDVDATLHMLEAVSRGGGGMAQFDHPAFSGSGQWMRGGMTMVSNLFDNVLKGRVDALCSELSDLLANQPDTFTPGSFQSQSQGSGSAGYGGQWQASGGTGGAGPGYGGGASFGAASLFVPPVPGDDGRWWPDDLGWPSSSGMQNGVRYAYFPQVRRLAIDVGGHVTVYDTGDHAIGGFGQQQSVGGTLSFTSQYGLLDVARLPVVSGGAAAAAVPPMVDGGQGGTSVDAAPSLAPEPQSVARSVVTAPAAAAPAQAAAAGFDIITMIERLADLNSKGILTNEEFAAKKAELLGRL